MAHAKAITSIRIEKMTNCTSDVGRYSHTMIFFTREVYFWHGIDEKMGMKKRFENFKNNTYQNFSVLG